MQCYTNPSPSLSPSPAAANNSRVRKRRVSLIPNLFTFIHTHTRTQAKIKAQVLGGGLFDENRVTKVTPGMVFFFFFFPFLVDVCIVLSPQLALSEPSEYNITY